MAVQGKTNQQTTSDHWSELLAGDQQDMMGPDVYWLAMPEVNQRYQRKGMGGASYPSWLDYCLGEFLTDRLPVPRMLSLGCGAGGLERQLAAAGAFVECDAYDIAQPLIDHAARTAAEMNFKGINYIAADINKSTLPKHHYDAVWFHGSLHHIEALEHVYEQVRQALKPDGYLFFNEYVGPTRQAISARQAEVLRCVLRIIPERYRRSFIRGFPGPFHDPVLPDPAIIAQQDPSESVRSGEIMTVIKDYFDLVAVHETGGTLLHYILYGIAGNFRPEDPESMKVLNMLFTIEDTLLEVGDLTSDFATVTARPKAIPTPTPRPRLQADQPIPAAPVMQSRPPISLPKRIYHRLVPTPVRLKLRGLRLKMFKRH